MKRRTSDRGYYIVASYAGIGAVTYQIKDAGVQWLVEQGINARQLPASFGHGLLEILRESELVYTGGGVLASATLSVGDDAVVPLLQCWPGRALPVSGCAIPLPWNNGDPMSKLNRQANWPCTRRRSSGSAIVISREPESRSHGFGRAIPTG